MYNIDINFLNDRPEYRPETVARRASVSSARSGGKGPLVAGGAVAAVCILASAGYYASLVFEQGGLEARDKELQEDIASIQSKFDEVKAARAKIQQLDAQTQNLASTVNFIRPWSAVMDELRDRIPEGVQIGSVQELQIQDAGTNQPPPPAAGGAPPPTVAAATGPEETELIVRGIATSFETANQFLVALQKSSFVKPEDTELAQSTYEENPTKVNFQSSVPQELHQSVKLPNVVSYEIRTHLASIPTSELLQELKRKKSDGIVARFELLREQGVLSDDSQ